MLNCYNMGIVFDYDMINVEIFDSALHSILEFYSETTEFSAKLYSENNNIIE